MTLPPAYLRSAFRRRFASHAILLRQQAAPDMVLVPMRTLSRLRRNRQGGHRTFLSCRGVPCVAVEEKYVNMTDLILPLAHRPSGADHTAHAEPIWNVIELLFFAYRDFIGDPDDVLAKLGFG